MNELEKKYILFQGENCPCKKTNCKYHGKCTACMAHHHKSEHKTKTECDRIKAKMERQSRKSKSIPLWVVLCIIIFLISIFIHECGHGLANSLRGVECSTGFI